jgi:hypothetical protein
LGVVVEVAAQQVMKIIQLLILQHRARLIQRVHVESVFSLFQQWIPHDSVSFLWALPV